MWELRSFNERVKSAVRVLDAQETPSLLVAIEHLSSLIARTKMDDTQVKLRHRPLRLGEPLQELDRQPRRLRPALREGLETLADAFDVIGG